MVEIKLTKNELRAQQKHLSQLRKYLPTLQLKKAMLQAEVFEARLEIEKNKKALKEAYAAVEEYSSLLSAKIPLEPASLAKVIEVQKRYENIAGVEVPYFESIAFEAVAYSLFDSPPWLDQAILGLRFAAECHAKVRISEEKKNALEDELRQVSIRVNLFEKILIPRALKNIKKIKVFLGDQELASVSRAKVAKTKIEKHKVDVRSGRG